MKRTISITGTLRREEPERFIGMYAEVQTADTSSTKGLSVRWHLEDENRPKAALCGWLLHESCRLVSPALVMFGKPCPDCRNIVAQYLFDCEAGTSERRFKALLGNDVIFRANVTKTLDPSWFVVNLPFGIDPQTGDPLPVEEKKTAKKKRVVRAG